MKFAYGQSRFWNDDLVHNSARDLDVIRIVELNHI